MSKKSFFQRLVCVCMASILVGLAPAQVGALTEAELDMYAQNNILFYDPGNTGCGYGTIAGSTLFEKVLSYLLSIGLTEVAAAGIYGNMMREGLGSGTLLEHENGVDERRDIGTWYSAATHYGPNGLFVKEQDVRDLWNPSIMHGVGFIGWSFGRRVNLMNALKDAGGLDKYVTEWDSVNGRYVYDHVNYDDMAGMIGQSTTDAILVTILEFFNSEHQDKKVRQSKISAQGLAKYGITAGMPIFEALNLLSTPTEAAELFFTVSEKPGYDKFNPGGNRRAEEAEKGYELIKSAGLTANGVTKCGGKGGSLAEIAISMAWPNENGTCVEKNGTVVDWSTVKKDWKCRDVIKPEYREVVLSVLGGERGLSAGKCPEKGVLGWYQDCGHFVAMAIHYSGIDKNFPKGGTSNMIKYLRESEKWQEIENLENTSNLQAGDVFIFSEEGIGGHIMLYTGDYSPYGVLAEANWCTSVGNMHEIKYDLGGHNYYIYRFVGDVNGA